MTNLSYELILKMDLDAGTQDGPGWYLRSPGILVARRIEDEQARLLINTFSTLYGESDPSLSDLLASGTRLIQQTLREQLVHAEEQAKRAETLRKRLELSDSIVLESETKE
jgi:hypothetical protein